jgi:hypothetical protein
VSILKKKYPRTLHLPFSESVTSDDKVIKSTDIFKNKRVIVTEKMDGENSSLYNDNFHARSLDSKHHESRSWLKRFHNSISYLIKENEKICGENLFAQHSIKYDNLLNFFYAFSYWVNEDCMSWDDTIIRFKELSIQPVPVLYDGVYDEAKIKTLFNSDGSTEGYVVRLADSFKYSDFSNSVAKFVRKNHVQTDTHWMHKEVIPNKLKI